MKMRLRFDKSKLSYNLWEEADEALVFVGDYF
jgi:hypothetical protein